ncbi:hypothetical protein BTR14_18415 [Rhizobium rhizosphaerae]|uniref:Uncharacterized protein n=1 Tax=Xaviernesmea rhizosphaerae TaxID=1672749 RepID=A0ABX3P9D4_9HYPH|nr:hypothetical protein [Xaviernesmea rhizosphaerae]OQP84607.1 hypothetical protein BTR14_18415 [Xaviernesmea rhizosphaerae]
MSRFVANTEAGTSGQGAIKSDQFQTYVRQNGEPLRAAGFSNNELALMGCLAEDLQRANRSNAAVKLSNASDTAEDVTKIQEGEASRPSAPRL